ncbi:nucleotide sugar dehydrogenase [Thalassorhabdus alkalitolerans]|uniref:Nucleotide sugar dehydrogenase n=2 Tax=Thalassorhabdus alkalitolerans TaxID=2282697 RepID=A0ABW0YJW7_9BACI|nr:nucleotide sugar dehydrogenase [Bacillus sp. FJAT-44742]
MEKISNKNATVGVVGLGYVGLPLAVEVAKQGFNVYGFDVSEEKVNQLKDGNSYVMDVSDSTLQDIIDGSFVPTTDFSNIKHCDAISICVPTPLNKTKDPDVSFINAVVQELIQYMTKDTVVILESTTYPGTTEELIKNVIEEETDYKVGEDVFLCFSPERVDPGNPQFNTKNTPKVIGGVTPTCLEIGLRLYNSFLENLVPVSSTSVAEMVKLLENTFRSVNIGLVNELTVMCDRMDINVWEVIDAAATKPFGYMPFYPGPGIGGHCIPLDPMYLSWKAKMFNFYNRFIELASDVNGNMPRYVLQQVSDLLNENEKPIKNSNVLIVGLAYKKDIDDLRESPAVELFRLLEDKGANVTYHDPYVKSFKNRGEVLEPVSLDENTVSNSDIVVIATNHTDVDYQMVIDNAQIVYDTRNVTKKYNTGSNVVLLGGSKHDEEVRLLEQKFGLTPK